MSRNALNNASWIVGCKMGQSLIALVIGMITARYLGPSNYGLISYAASIVAFFTPLMKLGLNNTLVQEIVYDPDSEGKILGTSIVLCFIASIASVVGIVSFSLVFNAGETETIIVCFLYSLTLIFQSGEMLIYWFQAKLLSKASSLASLVAYVIVAVYKVYILATGKNIRWFVITHAIEACIISVLLFLIYKKIGSKKLSFSWKLGKRMFQKSKYYISSGVIMIAFQQTDRVMLKFMSGQTETGYYSAASTCVTMTAFVFAAIIESIRPTILTSKKTSEKEYKERIVLLFFIIMLFSLMQCVAMTLLARPIVSMMYGKEYLASISVLQILVWNIIFSYIGLARNVWILAEEKQKYLWIINLSGVFLNVLLNLAFIPRFGAMGAAIATLSSQFFANIVVVALINPIRPVLKFIYQAMNPKLMIEMINYIKKMCKRKGSH